MFSTLVYTERSRTTRTDHHTFSTPLELTSVCISIHYLSLSHRAESRFRHDFSLFSTVYTERSRSTRTDRHTFSTPLELTVHCHSELDSESNKIRNLPTHRCWIKFSMTSVF